MEAMELQRKVETALSMQQSGRLQEAAAMYHEVLQAVPGHFDALHLLGVIVNQSGDPAGAAELIGRALQQNPRHPFAQNNLGLALQDLGRLDEAATCYRAALAVKPDFADAYFNLGNVLLAQGQADKAVASYTRAVQLQPQDAQAHNNLGSALRSLGRLEQAVDHFSQATILMPGYAEAWNNLGVALQEQDKLDQAECSLRQALKLHPGYAEALNNLGVVFLKQNDLNQAIEQYRKALAADPEYAEAYRNLGSAMHRLGRFDEAESAYRKAIGIQPEFAEALASLGTTLGRQGKIEEALDCFRRSLALSPELAETSFVGMASIHIDLGQFDVADELLDKALASKPRHPLALALRARVRKMTPDDQDWLETATQLAGQPDIPLEERIPLQYALGKFFDDTKQYDLAFAAYRKANEMAREQEGGFDREGFARLIDALIATCDEDFIRLRNAGASDTRLPVLVVGMPRAGTSLIEQIIASHPDAFGAGELRFWGEQFETGLLSGFSGGFVEGTVAKVASEYEKCLRQYSKDALRIVDKMPGNFLRMGFIHAIFPQAAIIHAQRDPVDTCLSIYFQNLPDAYSFGTDLDDLAFYFREYDRLMRHWRTVMPEERYFEVQYESLIEDQENWSRRIIEFIGLPWNDCVLDFHETERRVGTSSNWQVRQKIYKSSKARWKNYAQHLGPLLALRELEEA